MLKKRHALIALLTFPLLFSGTCEPEPGPPGAGLYHIYDEITTELQNLESDFPAIAKVFDLGNSVEGRTIWGIKISDNVDAQEDEPEVLLIGGHHAREWIAVDVPFLLIEHLLENYGTDSFVTELIDNGQVWVIPLLNPDGHEYSVTTNRLWRKNRRNNGDGSFGVDLNRNYSYQWGGPGSSGDTFSETYRGPAPFFEPETQVIRDLSNDHDFIAMISYHSYSQLILYPWGHTNSPAPDAGLMGGLAQTIADSIRNVHGVEYVPQKSSDLYLASGDATDWLYGETGVPSYTIELRPRSAFPGFELPESQIQPTFEENLPATLFLIKWTQTTSLMPTM